MCRSIVLMPTVRGVRCKTNYLLSEFFCGVQGNSYKYERRKKILQGVCLKRELFLSERGRCWLRKWGGNVMTNETSDREVPTDSQLHCIAQVFSWLDSKATEASELIDVSTTPYSNIEVEGERYQHHATHVYFQHTCNFSCWIWTCSLNAELNSPHYNKKFLYFLYDFTKLWN